MSRKTKVLLKSIGGLSQKVVTLVTDRNFSYGSCVTSCPQKVVTPLVTLVTKWLQFGYKVVTAYLAIRINNIYVNWLQSGYVLFSYEPGGCNHFSAAQCTPRSFGGEK